MKFPGPTKNAVVVRLFVHNGGWKKKEVDVMVHDGSGKIVAARSAR